MTKLKDIFEAKLNGTASPLAEAKNSSRTKLKPWATELAAIVAKVLPKIDFGVAGMGGEGEMITKAEYTQLTKAFKEAGYEVKKGGPGYQGQFFVYSKTDPKKGLFFQPDPWGEDKDSFGMAWQD